MDPLSFFLSFLVVIVLCLPASLLTISAVGGLIIDPTGRIAFSKRANGWIRIIEPSSVDSFDVLKTGYCMRPPFSTMWAQRLRDWNSTKHLQVLNWETYNVGLEKSP